MEVLIENIKKDSDNFALFIDGSVKKFIENKEEKKLIIKVKRKLACNKVNCCSSLFSVLLKPTLKMNLDLPKNYPNLNFKKNQKIKLALNQKWMRNCVISFYLLPLMSFMLAGLILDYFGFNPFVSFISGIMLMATCLLVLRKNLEHSLDKQLKILL